MVMMLIILITNGHIKNIIDTNDVDNDKSKEIY